MTNNIKNSSNGINWHKLIKRYVAKPVAFIALVAGSAYGYNSLFEQLDGRAAGGVTVLLVSALVYIISDKD